MHPGLQVMLLWLALVPLLVAGVQWGQVKVNVLVNWEIYRKPPIFLDNSWFVVNFPVNQSDKGVFMGELE